MPAPHLRPDGPDAAAVRDRLAKSDEKRIAALRERLERLRTGLDRDFTFSALKGRAKADFERSR